jgi:hypothetical protein
MYQAHCLPCGWRGAFADTGSKYVGELVPHHQGGEGRYATCPTCGSTDVNVLHPDAAKIGVET